MILDDSQTFTETLVVNDFPLAQKTNGVTDLGVFYQTKDVIISRPGFLFSRHIFMKICDRISFGLKVSCGPWSAAGRLRPECQSMIDIIFIKTGFFNLLRGQISGQLMDDGADHLHVGEFVRPKSVSQSANPLNTRDSGFQCQFKSGIFDVTPFILLRLLIFNSIQKKLESSVPFFRGQVPIAGE